MSEVEAGPAEEAGRSRWLKLFSSAVVDQALLSAANFLVGLLLIRNCSDEDYGHYVLGFTALLLLTGLQGAYIGGPLSVLAPRQSPERKRRMLASLYRQSGRWTARVALSLAVGCGLLGLAGWLAWSLATLGAVYCAVIAFALQREYLRTGLMIYERPQAVLRADLVYVALLVAGVAAAALLSEPAVPWAFAAMAAASLVGARLAHRELARAAGLHGEELPGLWRELAPLGGWAMVGTLVYWSFSQGYNYVVAGTLDLAAVAALNAARLLMMPANLMVSGIKQLLLPMAARWHQSLGLDPMLRRLLGFAAAVMALSLIYFGLLWLLRDWVFAVVLKKQFADRDEMLLLWMLMFLIAGLRDLLMTGLLVRERFRSMTGLSSVSALFSLLTCWWGTQIYGPAGAILGLVLGETINLVGVLWLTVRERRLQARAT